MINVMVIDDSALVRKMISQIMETDKQITIVDQVIDPLFAMRSMADKKVDVIILDIQMPRMNGLTFLKKLMSSDPRAVIVLSSQAAENSNNAIKALEYGAFDVIEKTEKASDLPQLKTNLIAAVHAAARSNITRKLKKQFERSDLLWKQTSRPQNRSESVRYYAGHKSQNCIVMGASTGGTNAIAEILKDLGTDIPAVVIVIHMPANFTEAFARRLDSMFPQIIKVAENHEVLENGTVYIAPAEIHTEIEAAAGSGFRIKLVGGGRVNYHCPSVEVLFESAASLTARKVIGVMLTGMGEDGSLAMLKMREAGAFNIVQDEDSSVVWGMPGKAVEYGAASIVIPVELIAGEINRRI